MPVRASVFSYFELDDLKRLMDAIAGSAMPAGDRVHIGSYGVNREASITVHTYRQGRYSPMFKAEIRTEACEQRRLTADEERRGQQLERASFRIVGEESRTSPATRFAPPARKPTGSARSRRGARCGVGLPAATSPA